MSTQTSNPLVSVVITAYNQGPYLARSIESALSQTYPHVEVIVVNDGSSDRVTRGTAMRYAGRIRYIERENGGIAAARNTGIAEAKGEFIALLDHDDVWLPQKLSRQISAASSHPRVSLVHSSFYYIDEQGQRTGINRLPEGEWWALPSLLVESVILTSSTLVPRRVYEEYGPLDPALSGSDEWFFYLHLAARGHRFYCIAEPLLEYRLHAEAGSRNIDNMVRVGLGALDRFYSLPDLPKVAQDYRGQAYATRHVWAAAEYYGAGRLDKAREQMRLAAEQRPEGVSTGRFVQSLIYSRNPRPTLRDAREALRFVYDPPTLARLTPALQRRLKARGRLVLALHTEGKRSKALSLARVFTTQPGLLADSELWQAGGRLLGNRLDSVKSAATRLWPARYFMKQRPRV